MTFHSFESDGEKNSFVYHSYDDDTNEQQQQQYMTTQSKMNNSCDVVESSYSSSSSVTTTRNKTVPQLDVVMNQINIYNNNDNMEVVVDVDTNNTNNQNVVSDSLSNKNNQHQQTMLFRCFFPFVTDTTATIITLYKKFCCYLCWMWNKIILFPWNCNGPCCSTAVDCCCCCCCCQNNNSDNNTVPNVVHGNKSTSVFHTINSYLGWNHGSTTIMKSCSNSNDQQVVSNNNNSNKHDFIEHETETWVQAVQGFLQIQNYNKNKNLGLLQIHKGHQPKYYKNHHFASHHVEQLCCWDCGVACLLMILEWLGSSSSSSSSETMGTTTTFPTTTISNQQQQTTSSTSCTADVDVAVTALRNKMCCTTRDWILSIINTQSIWTVDLVYILETILNKRQQQQQQQLSFHQLSDLQILTNNNTDSNKTKSVNGTDHHPCEESLNGGGYYNEINENGNSDDDDHHLSTIVQNISSFQYLFSSKTLSVNPTLYHYPYYASAYTDDCIRVHNRFTFVKNMVQQEHLHIYHMIHLIQKFHCIAIVLVDNSRLSSIRNQITSSSLSSSCSRDKTKQNGVSNESFQGTLNKKKGAVATAATTNYTGHYIIVSGVSCDPIHVRNSIGYVESSSTSSPSSTSDSIFSYDDDDDFHKMCFIIHNPSSKHSQQYLSISHFQYAWRAQGTDEDIIFIRKGSTG